MITGNFELLDDDLGLAVLLPTLSEHSQKFFKCVGSGVFRTVYDCGYTDAAPFPCPCNNLNQQVKP